MEAVASGGARDRRPLPHPATIDVIQNFGTAGRSRWMPDGRSLVYLDVDTQNNDRLYRRPLSDWMTGEDHGALVFPDSDDSIESFGISPDGRRVMLSITDWLSGLSIADGVQGVTPRDAPAARGR